MAIVLARRQSAAARMLDFDLRLVRDEAELPLWGGNGVSYAGAQPTRRCSARSNGCLLIGAKRDIGCAGRRTSTKLPSTHFARKLIGGGLVPERSLMNVRGGRFAL